MSSELASKVKHSKKTILAMRESTAESHMSFSLAKIKHQIRLPPHGSSGRKKLRIHLDCTQDVTVHFPSGHVTAAPVPRACGWLTFRRILMVLLDTPYLRLSIYNT
jgi:hypothetical protein